jgi:hypothetical protein
MTDDEPITLRLTQYERDNLLAALGAASGYHGSMSPLMAVNTGDWLMQVAHKLGFKGPELTDYGRPNVQPSEMVANARRFLIQEEPEWHD